MSRTKKSLIQVLTIFFLTFFCILASPAIARIPQVRPVHQSLMQSASQSAEALVQSGRSQFDARRFTEAVTLLQQAVQTYQSENDSMGQAIALGN
ncbi:MAG: hypothetical protein LH660_15200, partial [Phormidesmis sp. CAN_BIN36]|nr:hypothetical protein [Phormidesmis sp. CAN_BIN36]